MADPILPSGGAEGSKSAKSNKRKQALMIGGTVALVVIAYLTYKKMGSSAAPTAATVTPPTTSPVVSGGSGGGTGGSGGGGHRRGIKGIIPGTGGGAPGFTPVVGNFYRSFGSSGIFQYTKAGFNWVKPGSSLNKTETATGFTETPLGSITPGNVVGGQPPTSSWSNLASNPWAGYNPVHSAASGGIVQPRSSSVIPHAVHPAMHGASGHPATVAATARVTPNPVRHTVGGKVA